MANADTTSGILVSAGYEARARRRHGAGIDLDRHGQRARLKLR
jgi:hypothetical protein